MPWYSDFFDEDYIRFHLKGGDWLDERTPVECDFIQKALELQPPAKLLDLCCGQGRHAVELAKRGFAVTGADLSEYLLGLARQAAGDAGVNVHFKQCDMRQLPWEAEFDAAYMMFTAFGYLETVEEDEKALRTIRRALKSGGKLIIDMHNREQFQKSTPPSQRTWSEIEGHFVLDEHLWNAETKIHHLNRTIVAPGGSRRHKYYDLRIYTHSEIRDLLSRAGLTLQYTYGEFDLSDFTPERPRMLILARA